MGQTRLEEVIELNVAEDGVQVEQSPFYHFYVLSFLADIHAWNQQTNAFDSRFFEDTVVKMSDFASHILSPDGAIPLIGSSLAQNMLEARPHLVEELSQLSPTMAWVASGGTAGEMPTSRSKLFEPSGWSIHRSSWTAADNPLQLVFDVGPWRTTHSQRDALSVFIFASGRPVVVDPGVVLV